MNLCSSFVAQSAVVMPGCSVGKGTMVAGQTLIQSSSQLGEGSVWLGSPAFCLDPGLDGRKRLETRWHFSMRQLMLRQKERPVGQDSQRALRSGWGRMMRRRTPSMGAAQTQTQKNMRVTASSAFSMGALITGELVHSKGHHIWGLLLKLASRSFWFRCGSLWPLLAQ